MNRKYLLIFVVICLVFVVSIGLVSCQNKTNQTQSGDNNDSIYKNIFINGPQRVELGKFNVSMYVLVIIKSDFSTEHIPMTIGMICQEDQQKLSTIGTHTITISYNGLSAQFTIEMALSQQMVDF